ncbi:hypothetical protein AX25_10760 [Listeria ivanovii WSLC3009]|nr:hypothetical protein AX25_10760 [Listeria ivanovii WSLC3009]
MRFTKTTESANQSLLKKQLTRDAFAAKNRGALFKR